MKTIDSMGISIQCAMIRNIIKTTHFILSILFCFLRFHKSTCGSSVEFHFNIRISMDLLWNLHVRLNCTVCINICIQYKYIYVLRHFEMNKSYLILINKLWKSIIHTTHNAWNFWDMISWFYKEQNKTSFTPHKINVRKLNGCKAT